MAIMASSGGKSPQRNAIEDDKIIQESVQELDRIPTPKRLRTSSTKTKDEVNERLELVEEKLKWLAANRPDLVIHALE